jgi:hypothetical protein
MTAAERKTHKDLLLHSLQGSLRLLERSTEDGAMFLLHTLVRGLTKMHGEGLLDTAEVKDWTLVVKETFTRVHPSLAAQLAAGLPLRSAELEALLADRGEYSDRELVERIHAVLADFRERGLRKPH